MIVYEENPNSGYIDDSFSNDEVDSEIEIENALAIINTGLNEKIIKSGYLKKKGEKRKVWKRRWFVFRPNRLSYYKNEKEYKLLKVIPLDDILSVYNYNDQQKYIQSINTNKSDSTPVSSKPQKQNLMNAFYVNTKERTYLLQAQSVDDRDQWIKALDSSISGKKTNAFNPHEFLVNNNLISSSMANNINQKFNNMNNNNNSNNSNHATITTNNKNVNNITSTTDNLSIESRENRNIKDNELNFFYTEEDEINHINQVIQNNMALQMPKVNIKEDYSKVYYINNVTQKTQKSKSTKAVNFSTNAPSVHILMDEESDDDTEELMKGDEDDDEDEDEEFKTAFEVEVKDKIGNNNGNDNDNEDNLEFFNSDDILNVIEKKLKFENDINLTGSKTNGNYSVTKQMIKSKKQVDLLSKEKLDDMEEEEEDDDEDDKDDDEYEEEEDDDDDGDDDDYGEEDEYMLGSSNDDHQSLSIYSQKKEYLKQQMEKDVIIQQGYMYKYRRNALKKKWKKYWFVIRNGNLFIYKNEQEYVVKSIIPLENTMAICEVKRTSRIGRKGKKNRVRYCFQLIQSIVPKMTEKQFSIDSVHTTTTNTTNTDLSNDTYFGRHNSFAEPNEISSSYSSSVSLSNQNGCTTTTTTTSTNSNSNSSNNCTNTINTMNTITEDIITSNFERQNLSQNKQNQNSISQLTNKINIINDNQHNKKNSNTSNNKNNDDKANDHSINKIKESGNTSNSNTEIDNASTTVEDKNDEIIKKKKTSILKINTNNSNKRLTGSFDSYSSFDDVNKNNTKYKRSSFLTNYMNTMSPTGNVIPVTPKRKTFVKVFTFSAPTETSRKIWIANLLNECEKVQEN
jgi:hypothetical protein